MDDARIDLETARSDFSLTVKRNCSLSPQAFGGVLALIAGVSFAIGVGFALHGAWPVLPFVGLEIAALAAAFCVAGYHAADYERIALADGALVVQIRDGGRTEEHRFNPYWVRLVASGAEPRVRLALRSHGRELEIGRHLDGPGRERLAALLRGRLGGKR